MPRESEIHGESILNQQQNIVSNPTLFHLGTNVFNWVELRPICTTSLFGSVLILKSLVELYTVTVEPFFVCVAI